ncbi:MAG: anti-sigma factor [Pseudomonadota bacterium]
MAGIGERGDLTAAERALGLIPPGRESVAERAARETWEARFAVLADLVAPVAPPERLFEAIEARIDGEGQERLLERLRRRVRLWQATAAVALVLAPPAPAKRYVAVVQADADPSAPGMIVQFDVQSGVATLVPVPMEAPPDRAFEMWQLPAGATRPVSLGLLPSEPTLRRGLNTAPGDTFAISLEPAGGSPTGQPTMPLYHGRVIAVGD